MKKLFWRLLYVFWLRKATLLPILYCWDASGSALENIDYDTTEQTPKDSVCDEISYMDAD
jgi:hypothetical protein